MRAVPGTEDIRTLADVVPARAARHPERVALLTLHAAGDLAHTTYAELRGSVWRFAARLHAEGVRPGSTVAILMPNSRRWVEVYYAVFRLGAVAVPLDYGMLAEDPGRLSFALSHSEAAVVVCRREDAGAVAELSDARLVPSDEEADEPPPQPPVRPSDLAQILYTSGTTGPRKGVELTHSNVVFDADRSCRRFGVARRDCLPALLPYHHAYPLTTTVVLPLYAGARMACGDVRDRRSRELMRLSRPTVLVGVPRVFEAMLDGIRRLADRQGRLAQFEQARRLSATIKRAAGLNVGRLLFRRVHVGLFGGLQLRFAVSGGARISPRVLREFFLLGIPVVQGWGMSELSPVGAVQQFSPWRFYLTRHYERKAGSIGRPLADTCITFTQSRVEELSFDLEHWGEMLVAGPHVMRGYHRDPERTARQMEDGAVRSGDIGRRDRDGDLYVIGRVKHVIVLPSGKKIFPEEELEEPLSACETIDEFAVRPVSEPEGDGEERIGIIVRPDLEAVRDAETLGQLYGTIKRDIDRALAGGPGYLRQYDFCLTEWREGEFAELVKTGMGDPSPLRNPFAWERAYSRMKGSDQLVPWSQ